MEEISEHKKTLLIWRLRRDLEALKDLSLRLTRGALNREELRKHLVELHCYYEDIRRRLIG